MKKSDLSRRAYRAAPKHWSMDAQDSFAYGFESGYRAARANLRRLMKAPRPETTVLRRYGSIVGAAWIWLRPIR